MKTAATKETKLTEEQLAVLNESFPVSTDESSGLKLPRLGMISKNVTEETGTGRNKKIVILQPAGSFFTESDEGEVDAAGKKVWTRHYIEEPTIEGTIVFYRRQLRLFDASLKKYISTPIFDNENQVIPMYLDRKVIKRGTQEQLQSLYPALTLKGIKTSDLKEEAILYVLYDGKLHQMNISQSSKWLFKAYKKSLNPSTVVTEFGSLEDEFGGNVFSKTTFASKGMIAPSSFDTVVEAQNTLKDQVESDEKFYLAGSGQTAADKKFDEMGTKEAIAAPAVSKKGKDF